MFINYIMVIITQHKTTIYRKERMNKIGTHRERKTSPAISAGFSNDIII